MIEEPTVRRPLTFEYKHFCKADHLPRTPVIQKLRILEVNKRLLDIWPTTERDVGQRKVHCRIGNDREEAQILNRTSQMVVHRHRHSQVICSKIRIGRLRHGNTIARGGNKRNKRKEKVIRDRNRSHICFASLGTTKHQTGVIRENGGRRHQKKTI